MACVAGSALPVVVLVTTLADGGSSHVHDPNATVPEPQQRRKRPAFVDWPHHKMDLCLPVWRVVHRVVPIDQTTIGSLRADRLLPTFFDQAPVRRIEAERRQTIDRPWRCRRVNSDQRLGRNGGQRGRGLPPLRVASGCGSGQEKSDQHDSPTSHQLPPGSALCPLRTGPSTRTYRHEWVVVARVVLSVFLALMSRLRSRGPSPDEGRTT